MIKHEEVKKNMEELTLTELANFIWNNMNASRSFPEIKGNEQLEDMLLSAQIAADVIIQRIDYNSKNTHSGVDIIRKKPSIEE